jgi:hypothetical protein
VNGAVARALRMAGNQGIRTTQASAIDYVTGKKFIRPEVAKKGLPLTLPRPSTELGDLEWIMRGSNKPTALSKFAHVDTRRLGRGRGVLARVNVGKPPSRIATAFVTSTDSGHMGVFRRKGRARYPLEQLVSSRISDPLLDQGAADAALAKGLSKMTQAYPKALDREFQKLRSKGLA